MKTWLAFIGLATIPLLVSAQPQSIDQLLREVRELRSHEQALMREREAQFVAERDQQQKRLREAEQAMAQVKAESERLTTVFEQQEQAIAEARAQLQQRSGNLGELFGVVRQSAGDTRSQWQDSQLNVAFPDRLDQLEALSESRDIPTTGSLEQFWLHLLEDMHASGQVSRLAASVVGRDGQQRQLPVILAGPFVTLQGQDYLLYQPDQGHLQVAARQPAERGLIDDFSAQRSGLADLNLDPTRGTVLAQMQQTPSVLERVHQGGVVGYVILLLGALGLLLALGRLAWLHRVQRRVDRQVDDLDQLRTDNPLGRVLGVIGSRPRLEQLDTLELKLDEAILKETPALERWQGLIKLLAAVAPLLGLLGTVTGMIATFQAITLFGTGDPKLMAGGISQALVTTVLGLIVAIPLLFMHSLVAARSKALIQLLEQQSAGLIALHLGGEDKQDA